MDRFEAMQVFVKIVETGSLSAAAERLDISATAVSRHLAQLEAQLRTRLLHRSTRRISLTENGRAYHERCVQLLADLADAEELATNESVSPRGLLRLTAPISFGVTHLAPAISTFGRQHPALRFDISLSDRAVDLVEEGLDLAIRVGYVGSQNVVARPIGQAAMRVCAAPAYLREHGRPAAPADLAGHACLTYAYASNHNTWEFERAGERVEVKVQGPVHANNGTLLGEMAAQGFGVTMAPDFIVRNDLANGRLHLLLEDWEAPLLPIYAVYPSRRHLSAAVRSFADYLAAYLAEDCPSGRADP